MLHMVVATHGPDTCPAVIPELRDKRLAASKRMDEVTKKLGITVQGGWVNMPGHILYFMVDAPNAHVVNQMMVDLQFMEWNTVVVNPVTTMQEATARLQPRKP